MIETKRADKKKNIAKVIKEVLKDPLQSQREIAKKTWLWLWTANRVIQEVEQNGTKDDRILWVCETDFRIVKLWQAIIEKRLQDSKEVAKMRTFEIAQTIEKSEKRYQIFKWDISNNEWWLKQQDIIFQIINPYEWEENN